MASSINSTSAGNGGLVSTGDDSGILNIQTNETTAITVDTSQNVGVGTTNPDFGSYGAGERILGISNPTSGTRARLSFQNLSTSTSGISGTLAFFNGSTILGSIDVGADGATNKGYYAFNTNNGTSNSERMRIDSLNVLMGQTSASNSSFLLNCVGGGFLTTRVNIGDNGGFSDGSTIFVGSDSTNSSSWNQSNANYRFGSNRGGCVVAINPSGYTYEGGSGTTTRTFAVNSNGNVQNTNNSYGSLSDAKLKENITDATPKLESLMRVKIRNFNLIADEAKTKQIGVVAQELEEIFPSMIDEHIDYTFEEYIKEDGSKDSRGIPTGTVTKEVKYSVFVPMLIKAIQELKAINDTQAELISGQAATINALTARIVALEGK